MGLGNNDKHVNSVNKPLMGSLPETGSRQQTIGHDVKSVTIGCQELGGWIDCQV